jgi:hypothetical protein
MVSRSGRQTRVTLRCLVDDLELDLPTLDVDLGGLDHPLLAETRRVTPTSPQGQKRILAIAHPLVYRLRHGRWRGATWLESEAARFWLLAGAQRAEGSQDDAYEVFESLHRAGKLLPTGDDRRRHDLERNARVLEAARSDIPLALEDAAAQRGEDVAITLGELVDARLLVSDDGDEVWVAIARRTTDNTFVREPLRDLLFAIAMEAAGAEVTEPRADWPSGALKWFEAARLGLRDPV